MAYPFYLGQACSGPYFIGRKLYLKKLQRLILDPQCPCVSIFGLPRIGKSSLVEELQIRIMDIDDSINFVKVDMAQCPTFLNILFIIIEEVLDLLIDYKPNFDNFSKIYDKTNTDKDEEGAKRLLERMLRFASQKCIKIILVIDEFDAATELFCGESSKFQYIRGIINNSSIKVPIILISRDNIKYIETCACGGSRLHLAVQNFPVKGFNDDDMAEYYARLENFNVKLNQTDRDELYKHCGNNPFMLAKMGNSLFVQMEDGNVMSVEEAFKDTNRGQFNDYYSSVKTHLVHDALYDAFIKIFIGPMYDLKQTHIDMLNDKGYIDIHQNVDGKTVGVTTISKDFINYISDVELKTPVDNMNLVLQAERVLRKIVVHGFKEVYSEDPYYYFFICLMSENINKKLYSNDYKDQINFKKQINEKHDADVLKVSSIKDLSKIFKTFWDVTVEYQRYFSNMTIDDLQAKLDLLYDARNSYCHNNYQQLSDEKIKACELYATEIINLNKEQKFPEYGIINPNIYKRAKREFENSKNR